MTIEERAEIIYKGNTIEEDAYKRGAREQRKKDMEMFEKWYCKEKCYHRKQCLMPINICYRLGKIEKQMKEKYGND